MSEHRQRLEQLLSGTNTPRTLPGKYPHMTRDNPDDRSISITSSLKSLDAVVEFDKENLTLSVEPGITMDQLVRYTLPKGVLPKVVPEFKGITAGGAVSGAALESSSFRYGQFSDTCLEYEVVLPTKEIVQASRNRNPDLFHGVVGSYGALGNLSLVKLELNRAFPWVEVRYERCGGMAHTIERLNHHCQKGDDHYIDAVMIDPDTGIVVLGNEVESPSGGNTLYLNRPWSKWFCQHLAEVARKPNPSSCMDLIPTYDFLFRFDRAAFWMGRYTTNIPALFRYLFEWRLQSESLSSFLLKTYKKRSPTFEPAWLFRLLLNWKLSSTELYRVLHALPNDTFANTFFVHDFYLPINKVTDFMQPWLPKIGIFPVWLCPMKGSSDPQYFSPHYLKEASSDPAPHFINVGIYGVPRLDQSIDQLTKEVEEAVHAFGGRKMLYSLNGYSNALLREIYDHSDLNSLGKRWGCQDLFNTFRSNIVRI